ncbi:fatty acid coa synthetase family [Anaeramoeba flamelloides]|uniref:Fatty acid coa synthetase family n=1 Tax=Anaeramoeba flamelloides TaxID=1746091 RepID=A0ABQ8Y3M6_9EUKA|nr:fatty acid coa synthetase family [Anaeramoeba flamelloides]
MSFFKIFKGKGKKKPSQTQQAKKNQFYWRCDFCFKEIKEEKTRYHCMECSNFDLCTECFYTKSHEHPLYQDKLHDYSHQQKLLQESGSDISVIYDHMFEEYHPRPCFGKFNSNSTSLHFNTYCEAHYKIYLIAQLLIDRITEDVKLTLRANKPNFIAISSKNRLEWFLTDYACVILGISTIPIHHVTSAKKIAIMLEQTKPLLIVCSGKLIPIFEESRGLCNELIKKKRLEKEKNKNKKEKKKKAIFF